MPNADFLDALPLFPKFDFGKDDIDDLIPACKVDSWRHLQDALSDDFFNRPDTDLVYRGHRRHEWQLTPTLGRYSESGVIDPQQAERQLEEFRYAMRGRGASFAPNEDNNELWAYGQHYGLATPLLDWTESPFVALFFAFCDPDLAHEESNPSRPIFVLNSTSIRAFDEAIFVEPMRSDHTRLINQAGLFTLSPLGEKTFVTHIFDGLAENKVDTDDPQAVAQHICKIHVPNDSEQRRSCLRALRLMNIHHGTLFPDAIGASLYCNNWIGSRVVQREPLPPKPKPKPEPIIFDFWNTRSKSRPLVPSSDLPTLITRVAPQGLPMSADVAQQTARAILDTFSEYSGPDWFRRPNKEADLRVRTKKLLLARGWPNSEASAAAASFVEHLKSVELSRPE